MNKSNEENIREYHLDCLLPKELSDKLKECFVTIKKEDRGFVHHITVPAIEYHKSKPNYNSKKIINLESAE